MDFSAEQAVMEMTPGMKRNTPSPPFLVGDPDTFHGSVEFSLDPMVRDRNVPPVSVEDQVLGILEMRELHDSVQLCERATRNRDKSTARSRLRPFQSVFLDPRILNLEIAAENVSSLRALDLTHPHTSACGQQVDRVMDLISEPDFLNTCFVKEFTDLIRL